MIARKAWLKRFVLCFRFCSLQTVLQWAQTTSDQKQTVIQIPGKAWQELGSNVQNLYTLFVLLLGIEKLFRTSVNYNGQESPSQLSLTSFDGIPCKQISLNLVVPLNILFCAHQLYETSLQSRPYYPSSVPIPSAFLAIPNSLLIISVLKKTLSLHLVRECQTHRAAESAAVIPVITPPHSLAQRWALVMQGLH